MLEHLDRMIKVPKVPKVPAAIMPLRERDSQVVQPMGQVGGVMRGLVHGLPVDLDRSFQVAGIGVHGVTVKQAVSQAGKELRRSAALRAELSA